MVKIETTIANYNPYANIMLLPNAMTLQHMQRKTTSADMLQAHFHNVDGDLSHCVGKQCDIVLCSLSLVVQVSYSFHTRVSQCDIVLCSLSLVVHVSYSFHTRVSLGITDSVLFIVPCLLLYFVLDSCIVYNQI